MDASRKINSGRSPNPLPAIAMAQRWWIAWGGLFAFSALAVLPICGAMFRCGCTLWSFERYCNIHHAGGPHCPWCVGGAKVMLPGYLVAMLVATTIELIWLRRHRSIGLAMLLGAVSYLACLIASGWVVAKMMHYPTWFGIAV
jgi:hypothetical protein